MTQGVMTKTVTVSGRTALPADLANTVLLVDKPRGCSSFGIIKQLRRLLPTRKIGHAGTLDPAATGLLICLVGRRTTRRMESFMRLPKTYVGTFRLGEVTPSHDAETPVTERKRWEHLSMDDLERARQQFVGAIRQQPPMYSAVKVQGERLYKKARRGEVVARKFNTVHVYNFALTGWKGADVAFRVQCSKGTYIRALAHDMGQALKVGAHLVALRRTAIGAYHVRDAWTMDALKRALEARPQA